MSIYIFQKNFYLETSFITGHYNMQYKLTQVVHIETAQYILHSLIHLSHSLPLPPSRPEEKVVFEPNIFPSRPKYFAQQKSSEMKSTSLLAGNRRMGVSRGRGGVDTRTHANEFMHIQRAPSRRNSRKWILIIFSRALRQMATINFANQNFHEVSPYHVQVGLLWRTKYLRESREVGGKAVRSCKRSL